jgi:hypothetical protein
MKTVKKIMFHMDDVGKRNAMSKKSKHERGKEKIQPKNENYK